MVDWDDGWSWLKVVVVHIGMLGYNGENVRGVTGNKNNKIKSYRRQRSKVGARKRESCTQTTSVKLL